MSHWTNGSELLLSSREKIIINEVVSTLILKQHFKKFLTIRLQEAFQLKKFYLHANFSQNNFIHIIAKEFYERIPGTI